MEQMKKVELKHRLTVVQTVYHQLPGQQPISYESRFYRELETHEQPYERHTSVGEEWQPLDVGWLKDVGVGMLVICNDEGLFSQVKPTPAELLEASKKILNVGIGLGEVATRVCLVLPKESCRFYPPVPVPVPNTSR